MCALRFNWPPHVVDQCDPIFLSQLFIADEAFNEHAKDMTKDRGKYGGKISETPEERNKRHRDAAEERLRRRMRSR